MYSGTFFVSVGFGVVGDDSVEPGGKTSKAVLKDNIEIAVSGAVSLVLGLVLEGMGSAGSEDCFAASCSSAALKGFFTSLATFITTSNSMASSSFGSR